jgi:8-oxo-dGTP pyrophosphatase MutT (NUDIX family)
MKRKVTALITRPGPDGPEVIVFDHPVSGYQLPAGTVEDGESFAAAALREGWEETGALGLALARELAVSTLRDEDRHIFHLRATVDMPDEWTVVTPDGGGLTWECFWSPIDEAHSIVGEWQRDWLDVARPALDESARSDPRPRRRDPLPQEFHRDGVFEQFVAPPMAGRRFALQMTDACDPEACTRAHGLCVTAAGEVVLVRGDQPFWDLPGGGKESGESTAQNFAREVLEELCGRVVDSRFLLALRIVELDEVGSATGPVELHAQMWARVELSTWDPRFEISERVTLPAADAADLSLHGPITRVLLDRAAKFDTTLDWPPGRE